MSSNILDLSKYEKQNKIGEGGFAKVYKVIDKKTNQIYAAKILYQDIDDLTQDEIFGFSHEVNIMSKVNHPSILKFAGFSPVDFKGKKKPVILMEYAFGGSLSEKIKLERQSISISRWDETKKLINIYGIASGMSYLHSHNILHRDLKPGNILLDDFLFPKVSDFGLSKVNHSQKSLTFKSLSNIKGTPHYIAPEIWETQNYGKEGDVYAFSLIAYEIITKEVPFKNIVSIAQIYSQIIIGGLRPSFDFTVPKSYQNLITKCWSYDPTDRPTFDQIIYDLKNDPSFITDSIDKREFFEYVDYIDEYKTSFNSNREVVKLNEISESNDIKFYELITIDQNPIEKVVEEEEKEPQKSFQNASPDKKDTENPADKESPQRQFEMGKKHFEEAVKIFIMSKRSGCKESAEFLSKYFKNIDSLAPENHQRTGKIQEWEEAPATNQNTQQQQEELSATNQNTQQQQEEELSATNQNTQQQQEELSATNQNTQQEEEEELTTTNQNTQQQQEELTTTNQNTQLETAVSAPSNLNALIEQSAAELGDVFDHPYVEFLREKLAQHPRVKGRQRAVLVSTGSFCPIHKGHLKLFDTAARFLSEEHQIDTLLGIISPTSDIFVGLKFRSSAIPFSHRYEMTRLACDEHNKDLDSRDPKGDPKIIPDPWEGTRIDFLDFQLVFDHFRANVRRNFPHEDLLVLYVCGGDLFMKRNCFMRNGYVGISRPGFQIESPTDTKKHLYICNDRKYAGFYSDATFAINLAKESGESLEGLTYDSVAKYLHDVVHWS